MKIYTLTRLGRRLARSTNNPDNANWKVIYHLDRIGHGTPDQIASGTGISAGEVAQALAMLRRRRVVQEVSGGERWDF